MPWPRRAAVRESGTSLRCGESATALLVEAEQQVWARDERQRQQQGSQSGTNGGKRGLGTHAARMMENQAM